MFKNKRRNCDSTGWRRKRLTKDVCSNQTCRGGCADVEEREKKKQYGTKDFRRNLMWKHLFHSSKYVIYKIGFLLLFFMFIKDWNGLISIKCFVLININCCSKDTHFQLFFSLDPIDLRLSRWDKLWNTRVPIHPWSSLSHYKISPGDVHYQKSLKKTPYNLLLPIKNLCYFPWHCILSLEVPRELSMCMYKSTQKPSR